MAKVRRGKSRTTGGKPPASRAQRLDRSPDWLVGGLALFGMLVTGYLTTVALNGTTAAFCTTGAGCDVIQQSQWSRFLGLPIALWGFAVYALIAGFALRMPARLKRWQRLWYLAVAGVAVSLYLTAVGVIMLDAVCGWCLLSLATISAIFVSVALRRPDSAPGLPWRYWALNSGLIAAALVVTLHVYASGIFSPPENPRLKALAIHLEQSDAKFYGAFWCPHCQAQKKLFGTSADRLPYVECTPSGRNGPMADVCIGARIQGYPTWIIDGQRIQEVIEPEALADRTGFDWTADYSD